jgi:hypothetical protein
MSYRDDLDALATHCANLERELAESRAAVERATRARSLPLFDQIRVSSPCTASWEAMEGDHRVRFCGQCRKNVYNLSGMTREDAERLVHNQGDLCVRFYRRFDGTILTTDCPVGARKLRFRRATVAAVGASILAVSSAWLTARQAVTGAVAPPLQGLARPRVQVEVQAPMETLGEPALPTPQKPKNDDASVRRTMGKMKRVE